MTVNQKKEFCCATMYYTIEGKGKEIIYEPIIREYDLLLHNDSDGSRRQIFFCPWCGKNLPKTLDEEWGNILKEEYNIGDPFWEDKEKVLLEFWTDEWWKKRGL